MQKIKENGKAVYLKVDCNELEKRINNIHTRGIAMKNGTTLNDLFEEREPLYQKYADVTVDCTKLTPEECVDKIIDMLRRIKHKGCLY